MDQGIINAFKIRYRTHIVRRRTDSIDYGGYDNNLTVLEAIKFVSSAWNTTTSSIIQNCYRKAGFKSTIVEQVEVQIEEDPAREEYVQAWADLNKATNSFDFNQDEFLSIDNEKPVGSILTDEEILTELAPEPASEEPESEIPPVVVSKHEAIHDFKGCRCISCKAPKIEAMR